MSDFTRDPIVVSHYGVHWTSDGIAFLEQGGPKGGVNALGLREKSPFVVKFKGRQRPCNHNIPLAAQKLIPEHAELFQKFGGDQLVRALAPLPKMRNGDPGVWFVEEDPQLTTIVAVLSRMSSPIRSVIQPFWAVKMPEVIDQLGVTNVQPLILTNTTPAHTADLSKLVQAASQLPRRLLIMGDANVPLVKPMQKIVTHLRNEQLDTLLVLPWESYGAALVRGHMRNE